MIVLSDGSPSANNYRGDTAVTHVRKCVKHVEGRGWSIIQLGFRGAYEGYMKQMFQHWAYIDQMDRLSLTVSKLIRKVLKI
jgi:nitric oxide reductase activation protein